MKKRIVIGLSGAGGIIYGVEMLRLLVDEDVETHLIISEAGRRNIEIETNTPVHDVEAMPTMSTKTGMWALAWLVAPSRQPAWS